MTGLRARTAFLAVTAATGVVLALVALELIFGSWVRGSAWDRALSLNMVVDRTATSDVRDLYEGGGDIIRTWGRFGLRGNYGKPENITILTIGGSTTAQAYVGDGFTWQDVLQRQLRAAGKPATVANAGVDGHSSFGHLASYEYWFPLIPGLRPMYTVLYVGINDFFIEAPTTPFEGAADGRPTLKSRIKANSAFFRLYSVARGMMLARRMRLAHARVDFQHVSYTRTPQLHNHALVAQAHLRSFGQRFRKLLERASEHGSTPVCVTQPTLYYRHEADGGLVGVENTAELPLANGKSINGVDYFLLRRLQDSAMLSACREIGAPAIDLASAEWELGDFYDFMHMTPQGTKKMGDRIAIAMEQLPFERRGHQWAPVSAGN